MAETETVRLAELAASLSLATDIGLGVALENGQRAALMTVALAEAAGVPADEARDAFYIALLKVVGCTGDEDFSARVALRLLRAGVGQQLASRRGRPGSDELCVYDLRRPGGAWRLTPGG